MSRAAYYRDQARLCRDLAAQLSVQADAARLHEMAQTYEAEADVLERVRVQQQQQPQE